MELLFILVFEKERITMSENFDVVSLTCCFIRVFNVLCSGCQRQGSWCVLVSRIVQIILFFVVAFRSLFSFPSRGISLYTRQDATTLNRFVMASSNDHDLVILMNAIATSCKLITSAVQRAGIAKLYGLAGEVNSTGDEQKKLDVLSNDMMINALVNSGVCCVLISEENEEPIIVPRGKSGKFCKFHKDVFLKNSKSESILNLPAQSPQN